MPLILFLFLRFLVVNDFALLSFTAGLSGNAVHYLESTDIKKLNDENQKFAKNILEKKRKLPYLCNLDNNDRAKIVYFKNRDTNFYNQQNPCWNEYSMMVWLAAIKKTNNVEPFETDDARNIAPWLYVDTLSSFWTNLGSNVENNKLIKRFTADVYRHNKMNIFLKTLKSPYTFIKMQRHENRNLLSFYAILIVIFFIFNKSEEKKNKNFGLEFIFSLSFVIITLMNLIILYAHENGDTRVTIVQTFYFISIFTSYFIYLFIVNLKQNKLY